MSLVIVGGPETVALGDSFAAGVGSGVDVSVELGDASGDAGGVSFAMSVGDVDGDGDSVGVASCARTFGARDATVTTTIAIASNRNTRREADPPMKDIPDLRLMF